MICFYKTNDTVLYLQLQVALQGVKSDIPVQLERVNRCIERCQQLLSSDFNSVASISKYQVLQKVNEGLRYLALPSRIQLLRSKTSVDGERPPLRTRRNSHTVYSAPLSKIGEEDSDVKSTTLPKKLIQKFPRKHASPDHRPKSLKLHAKSSSSEVYIPPPVKASIKTSDTAAKSDKLSATTYFHRRKKRSPSPRRPTGLTPSTPLNPDGDLPRRALRKHERAPKLGILGKFGSSECHADIEDEDILPADSKQQRVAGRYRYSATNPSSGLNISEEDVIENMASCTAGNSPRPPNKKPIPRHQERQTPVTVGTLGDGEVLVVPVEIHENSATLEEHSPLESPLSSDDEHQVINDSTNSETALLSYTEAKDQVNEDLESTAHRQDLDKETNGLLEEVSVPRKSSLSTVSRRSSRQDKPRRVSFSDERKTSLSLDRKGNFMSSALKESSKFLKYTSLDDTKTDF